MLTMQVKKANRRQDRAASGYSRGCRSRLRPPRYLTRFHFGAALSKALIKATTDYYGTAAHSFLESITQADHLAALPATIKTHTQAFIDKNLPSSCGGQVRRVCERFALIATPVNWRHDMITGWPPGESEQAATRCFQAWIDYRGGADNQERSHFLVQVQAFFEAHGTSRFEDMNATEPHTVIDRVGFRQNTVMGRYKYFVLPQMFSQEICQGYDARWAAKILIETGMLSPSSEGKSQITFRLPGEGAKNVIALSALTRSANYKKPTPSFSGATRVTGVTQLKNISLINRLN